MTKQQMPFHAPYQHMHGKSCHLVTDDVKPGILGIKKIELCSCCSDCGTLNCCSRSLFKQWIIIFLLFSSMIEIVKNREDFYDKLKWKSI